MTESDFQLIEEEEEEKCIYLSIYTKNNYAFERGRLALRLFAAGTPATLKKYYHVCIIICLFIAKSCISSVTSRFYEGHLETKSYFRYINTLFSQHNKSRPLLLFSDRQQNPIQILEAENFKYYVRHLEFVHFKIGKTSTS